MLSRKLHQPLGGVDDAIMGHELRETHHFVDHI